MANSEDGLDNEHELPHESSASLEEALEISGSQMQGKKKLRKDTAGRPRFEGGLLKKHTILIQDDLWEWAQKQPKGATNLIRNLLEQERKGEKKQDPEQQPKSMGVQTPGGKLLVFANPEGINILLESVMVLNFSYNSEYGCHMAYIPSRVELLPDRVARHRAERAKAQGFESPVEDAEPNLSVNENMIDDEKD